MNQMRAVMTTAALAAAFAAGAAASQAEGAEESVDTSTELQVSIMSIPVEDQATALAFYTEKLGFVKKHDMPLGEYRWLTVVAPSDPGGPEVLLEPAARDETKTFQAAVKGMGLPYAGFRVGDVKKTHAALEKKGVVFTMGPTEAGGATIAIFDDTCGNLIQIYQEN